MEQRALPQTGCQAKNLPICRVLVYHRFPKSVQCAVLARTLYERSVTGSLRSLIVGSAASVYGGKSVSNHFVSTTYRSQMGKVEMRQSDTLTGMDPRSSIFFRYIRRARSRQFAAINRHGILITGVAGLVAGPARWRWESPLSPTLATTAAPRLRSLPE